MYVLSTNRVDWLKTLSNGVKMVFKVENFNNFTGGGAIPHPATPPRTGQGFAPTGALLSVGEIKLILERGGGEGIY